MKRFTLTTVFLFTIIVAFPSLSPATQFYPYDTHNPEHGGFTGEATYSFSDDSSAILEVTLTNTSPMSRYITALAFWLPNEDIMVASMFSTSSAFRLLEDSNAMPLGRFDFGAGVGNNWEGGSKKEKGIPVGSTETFTFNLTGTGLALLSLSDFTRQQDNQNVFTAVRFKQHGGDKVLGVLAGAQVPEPATLLLVGSGVVGYVLLRRRSMIRGRV